MAIAGNIGSGKTTLTRRIADEMRFSALFEPHEENPYLADFYEDMPRYALPLQLRFLADRVAQVRGLVSRHISAIQDRTCYEDAEIFARHLFDEGAMNARDWDTYTRVAEPLLAGLPAPDLLVYLRRSPAHCQAAVARRNRSYEQTLPDGYLAGLGARYDTWFEAYERGPKLCIEGEGLDLVERPEDFAGVLQRVRDALPQRLLLV